MKKCFASFFIIILYIGCQKHEVINVQQKIEHIDSSSIIAPIDSQDLISQVIPEKSGSIQEVIENYATASTELSPAASGTRVYAFQIEGNFTGSGNREIIAFYQFLSPDSLDTAFCFVCDPSGEKIINVYYINYGTLEFNDKDELNTGLSNIVGRDIVWRNQIIGRIADLNGTGKEELYLYSKSGMNIEPYFFEFDGTQFGDILNIDIMVLYAPIISIDLEKKIIKLKITSREDAMEPIRVISIDSYIWNNEAHRYEIFSREIKHLRWNQSIKDYEEVE